MTRIHTFCALSALGLFGCSGTTEDSGNTDDSGEARVPVAIDCTTITSLNRSWGGSSGPCGPEYVLSVDDTGAVSTSATEAYPPEGENDCETVTSDSSIAATEAEVLLLTVCEEINRCAYTSDWEQELGGWDTIGLYAGTDLLVSSQELYCEAGLTESTTALGDVWTNVLGGN